MKKLQAGLLLAVAFALTIGVTFASARTDASGAAAAPVSVQLLSFNDFHGNLEPPSGSSGRIGTVDAGGCRVLRHTHDAPEGDEPEHARRRQQAT